MARNPYRRVYPERVIKWAKENPALTVGVPLAFLIFAWLFFMGDINITGYSQDVVCAGTKENPCEAYINFTANKDVFLYPFEDLNYFSTDKPLQDIEIYRSWGSGWRKIDMTEGCTGSWCGCYWCRTDRRSVFSYAFRMGRSYQIKIVGYKQVPWDDVQWGFGEVGQIWMGADGGRAYTESTETFKDPDESGYTTMYSGVRHVWEDSEWKNVEDSEESLSEYFNVIYEDDWEFSLRVLDFGYRWIEFAAGLANEEHIGTPIPFRIDENVEETWIFWNTTSTVTRRFEVDNVLAHNYSFGFNTTTVQLQDADTENLEDTWTDFGGQNHGTLTYVQLGKVSGTPYKPHLKFNGSGFVNNSNVTSIKFCMFKYNYAGTNRADDLDIFRIEGNWTETGLTATNEPDNNGTYIARKNQFTNSNNNTFNCWTGNANFTTYAQEVMDGSHDYNLSIKVFRDSGGDSTYEYFYSKEFATASQRPYLNLTYNLTDYNSPTWSGEGTDSTDAAQNTLFFVKWEDDVNLSHFVFSIANGSYNALTNDTAVAFPSQGTMDWSNVSKIVNSTINTMVNWTVYANDTSNRWNQTDVFFYNTTTSDFIKWEDNTTNISSGTNYTYGAIYDFGLNVSITGGSILAVYLELDGVNYTATNSSATVWNVTFAGLPGMDAVDFSWYTLLYGGPSNHTDVWKYTVAAVQTNVSLYFDGQQMDRFYEHNYNAALKANLTDYLDNTAYGTVYLSTEVPNYWGNFTSGANSLDFNFTAYCVRTELNDTLINSNLSYTTDTYENKTVYVGMNSYDGIINATINLTGYYTNNSYPTNIRIYINETLSNYFPAEFRIGTAAVTEFNVSDDLEFNRSTSMNKYIVLPQTANVTNITANITGDSSAFHVENGTFVGMNNISVDATPGLKGWYIYNSTNLTAAHWMISLVAKPSGYAQGTARTAYMLAERWGYGEFYLMHNTPIKNTFLKFNYSHCEDLGDPFGQNWFQVLVNRTDTLVSIYYNTTPTNPDGNCETTASAWKTIYVNVTDYLTNGTGIGFLAHRDNAGGETTEVWVDDVCFTEYEGGGCEQTFTTPYAVNVTADTGESGTVVEWNFTGPLTPWNATHLAFLNETLINNWLDDVCTPDGYGLCRVPITISTTSPGIINITQLVVNYTIGEVNPVELNATAMQTYLTNLDGNVDVPITIESSTNGTVLVEDIRVFFNGSCNYTINASFYGNVNYSASTDSLRTFKVEWSNFSRVLPYTYTDDLIFVPASVNDTNVTPWGQTSTVPIYNITSFARRNFTTALNMNETISCLNITASNDSTKDNGTVLNTTYQQINTNISTNQSFGVWMWEDLDQCNATAYRKFVIRINTLACCSRCYPCW